MNSDEKIPPGPTSEELHNRVLRAQEKDPSVLLSKLQAANGQGMETASLQKLQADRSVGLGRGFVWRESASPAPAG